MKNILFTVLLLSIISGCSIQKHTFDPTGTYSFGIIPSEGQDPVIGYTGQIQVVKLSGEKIVMTFVVNKGAPSYNSGSFVDTLSYSNAMAIFTIPEFDPSCAITFEFDSNGVEVDEKTDNFNSGCGFGSSVVAKGYFKKISIEQPVLKNPMTGETL